MKSGRSVCDEICVADIGGGGRPQTPPPAEKLTADKPVTTSGGATFTAPAAWAVTTNGPMITVEAPEGDSRMVIYDSKASGADAAIAEAWAKYNPEAQVFLYETSPNERAVVQALARRFKDTWTVVIVDGKQPTFEKRGAAWHVSARDICRTEGGRVKSGAHRTDESLC